MTYSISLTNHVGVWGLITLGLRKLSEWGKMVSLQGHSLMLDQYFIHMSAVYVNHRAFTSSFITFISADMLYWQAALLLLNSSTCSFPCPPNDCESSTPGQKILPKKREKICDIKKDKALIWNNKGFFITSFATWHKVEKYHAAVQYH